MHLTISSAHPLPDPHSLIAQFYKIKTKSKSIFTRHRYLYIYI